MNRALPVVLAGTLLLGACGGSGGASATVSPSRPVATATPGGASPTGVTALSGVHVRLTPVVAGLEEPLAMAVRPDDDALYVAEQTGRVIAVRDGRADPTPVLDLSGQIESGGEQGLLGLTFSPDGRYLYVNYTDLDGNTNVVEFATGDDGRADVDSRREVLFVEQPYANHNGGNLAFGPDGDLYVGLGDGGGGGDPHGNGQNLGVLLGKMLRLEPRLPDGSLPPGGQGYAIPPDNPFVHTSGARAEIWAYGLRNPWRYGFDRRTGDLWIGDVGQGDWEEVDVQPASSAGGENYGWNRLEGTHRYSGSAPANAVPPVYEYSHANGACVVTGGFVYRGSTIADLDGAYVFADYCLGEITAFRLSDGRAAGVTDLGLHVPALASFGQDSNGELYALSLGGEIDRIDPA